MAWRLAIDFGTSNTAAAVDVQGAVRPIALSDGGITMPSAVVLTPTGFRVGEEAVNAQLRHPDGFERTPKALIGRGDLVLAGQIVSPEALITEVYEFVREAALRRQNNEEPSEVWLTHPVAWAPSQIEALRSGAVKAGFAAEAIRTVPEPIAAAAHYARNHQAAPGSRVAVFDFGGGTLDIAVLERAPHLPVGYRVLAYGGDPVLGGRTFDARLLDWTLDTLARRGHEELADRLHRPKTMSELRAQTALSRAVTAAKTELSTRPDADISVSLGEEDAVVTITRSEYESLIAADLERAGKLLGDVFERVSGTEPEVLYLTGGSSRTPAISAMIRERSQIEIATLDDPKLVVPEGALHVGPVSRSALDRAVPRSQADGTIPGGPRGGMQPPSVGGGQRYGAAGAAPVRHESGPIGRRPGGAPRPAPAGGPPRPRPPAAAARATRAGAAAVAAGSAGPAETLAPRGRSPRPSGGRPPRRAAVEPAARPHGRRPARRRAVGLGTTGRRRPRERQREVGAAEEVAHRSAHRRRGRGRARHRRRDLGHHRGGRRRRRRRGTDRHRRRGGADRVLGRQHRVVGRELRGPHRRGRARLGRARRRGELHGDEHGGRRCEGLHLVRHAEQPPVRDGVRLERAGGAVRRGLVRQLGLELEGRRRDRGHRLGGRL